MTAVCFRNIIVCELFLSITALCVLVEGAWQGCWSNNIVPYKITEGFSEDQKKDIRRQVSTLHNLTCVRWVDTDDVHLKGVRDSVLFLKVTDIKCETQRIKITNINSSNRMANRTKDYSVIYIRLHDVCFEQRSIMHEMMHAMGFKHEHQRADRDCYVSVDQETAKHDYSYHKKYNSEGWLERFPYDKYSVVHYKRSQKMKAKSERWFDFWEPLGNLAGELTFLDVWKLLYKFCNFPHYCDIIPRVCDFVDDFEKSCITVGR